MGFAATQRATTFALSARRNGRMMMGERAAAIKKYPLCWWCNGKLVGPGGAPGKEPLSFRLVDNPHGEFPVKVHVACEKVTKQFFL